ncbi:SPOR domain-containing protein [Roseobacter weihaiensis]|uniref:SPOR domain-containing protein n=1 Tax=Roseobacter weihaiensis TaxID=2763262 RepID=UPI001D0A0F57|nr:SPOR domain-containing protein [Roseobacter sp. H9]
MADVEFSHGMGAYGRHADGQPPQNATPNSLVTLTNIAGAAVSLALITGVAVWGYKLMVRDVSGIPVVRAAEGEMRVRPEDPGGQLARHQGLAVNEIAAQGVASGPVDRVVLAPADVALSEEDQPIVAADAAPVVPPAPLAPAAASFGETPQDLSARLQQGAIDEVVAALTANVTPLSGSDGPKTVQARPSADPAAPQPAVLTTTAAPIDAPGVRVSVRPQLRPANAPALGQQASYSEPAPVAEIDADAIPAGTRLVQLGAFDTAEVARAEWARLQARFGDVLQDKSRVVQQAQSGGRNFYRLRAMGFLDLNDTRRFCSAFKAEGVDCIPVQVK